MKYEIYTTKYDPFIINDYGDDEIGIWEMIESQHPEIFDSIDTDDIIDIIELKNNNSVY